MSLASSLSAASGSQASKSVQKHLIVLVHGYLGNDREMGYIQEALEREAMLSQSAEGIVVYSASSNVGRTTDVSVLFVLWA